MHCMPLPASATATRWRAVAPRFLALVGGLIVAFPGVGLGQQVIEPAAPEEINVAGLAVGIAPDHPGSDDYTIGLAPTLRHDFGDHRYIELLGGTLGGNVVDHPFLRLGPVLNYRPGRDNVDDPVVDLLSEVDDSIELGVSLGLSFVNETNERIRFKTTLEVLGDVSGGHDGALATLSARYWHPLGRAFDVGFGVSSTYVTQSYMNSFFGVNAADAATAGIGPFSADGGIRDISVTPMLVLHLSRAWHIGLGLRYQRLLGDAADSPITETRGSADQFVAGLGFAYSW